MFHVVNETQTYGWEGWLFVVLLSVIFGCLFLRAPRLLIKRSGPTDHPDENRELGKMLLTARLGAPSLR